RILLNKLELLTTIILHVKYRLSVRWQYRVEEEKRKSQAKKLIRQIFQIVFSCIVNVLLHSSMNSRISSLPFLVRALVTKYCGKNCHVSNMASKKAFMLCFNAPGFSLSVFVNAIVKANSQSPSLFIKSRSIC